MLASGPAVEQKWTETPRELASLHTRIDAGTHAPAYYSPDDSACTAILFLGTLGTANPDDFVQLTFAKYCHVPRYAIFENIAAPAARHLRHSASRHPGPGARAVAFMQPFCWCEDATGANLPWVFSPRSVTFSQGPTLRGARWNDSSISLAG
jgi:hypothetical protein